MNKESEVLEVKWEESPTAFKKPKLVTSSRIRAFRQNLARALTVDSSAHYGNIWK